MSAIDIRKLDDSNVDEIVFAADSSIMRDHGKEFIVIDVPGDIEIPGVDIVDIPVGAVDDLILALKKAKQLGWY